MENPAHPLALPTVTAKAAKPPVWRSRCKRMAVRVLPFVLLAVLWQALAYTQPAYVFPSLGIIFKTIASLAADGSLLSASVSTIQSVLIGAVLSLAVGTLIGFALARYETVTGPLLNFAQTVPYVVWALMSLIWFGLTRSSVVFTIFVAAFPIISFNVAAGLNNVDPYLLGMGQSVRANRYMVLRHIVFPSLTPYLVSASRSMLGMCWKISVLAELFSGGAGGGGIGYNLFTGWEFSRPNEVFAWTVWLVFMMMVSDRLFIVPLELLATRWKKA
ncbi:MAG: nitrate transporter permease [Herbaspirillum sp.]|jgi:ABC-type nitrate/sulfonate/bicarbonate transport system permease component|nr:nitrate transporter permease [Herbaspirillum sp.]